MGLFSTIRAAIHRVTAPPPPAPPAPPTQKPVFEKGHKYPHDGVSEYVDLDGTVTFVDQDGGFDDQDEVQVIVKTRDHGERTGYTYRGASRPPMGSRATIRLYSIGGGWYPDDRIIGWRRLTPDEED